MMYRLAWQPGIRRDQPAGRLMGFLPGRGEPFGYLTQEQQQRLRERYLPEVDALEELLRIDLSAWKRPDKQRATVA